MRRFTMIGTILGGRYEILEEIGKGGMAHVYKAHCRLLNRTVAVKVLRGDLEGGDEFIERFNTEAQSAAGLTHPNIVSIYDVGEDKGCHYIVMEYIDGITLKEYIKKKGKIPCREAAYIAEQICAALEAAHEKNIVHRDIKPHNIMITSDNRVKVTDFGIARASTNATMQVGDSILGSVHYISPEQARGGYVDCKSDIYSLGIVLYEMLTGKVPFESDSPVAVAMKHLEERPVPPCEIDPEIPAELQEIVMKAISKETRNRYQTITAMKSDLEAIMPRLPGDDDEKRVPQETEPSEQEPPSDEAIPAEEADDEDYDDDGGEEKPKGVGNMIFAAVLIAFLLVGGVSLGITWVLYPDLPIFSLFNNKDVEVPNFVGMNYDLAKQKAGQLGLTLEVGDRVNSAEDIDNVVEQKTAEGRKVKKGEVIVVYLSDGPGEIDFDEYIGMKADKAEEKLKAKGYKITTEEKSDTEIAEGCVISIKQKGSKLTVYVSKGYEDMEVIVPYLVGKKIDAAQQLLLKNTLKMGKVEYVESDIYEPGTVINQSIASGESVKAKTEVNVKVAGKVSDENEGKTETPAQTTRTKTISIDLPTDRASVAVRVVSKPADGSSAEKEVFSATLNPQKDPQVVLKVKGSTKNEFSIYFDGVLVSSKVVDFSE